MVDDLVAFALLFGVDVEVLLEDPELRALARPACRSALRASAQPHAKLDRIIQPPPLFAQAQLLEEHPPLPRPRPTPKPETPNISR